MATSNYDHFDIQISIEELHDLDFADRELPENDLPAVDATAA